MRKHLPAWAILTLIGLIAALCLGAVYELTREPIARRTAEEAERTRKELVPEAASFEEAEYEGLDSLFLAKNEAGETVGYVGKTTVQGFGGEIEVSVGLNGEGLLSGISVGGEHFSETAGLGARAKDAGFTDQFGGKTLPVATRANGGEIDALTASTITSNAVVRAVNAAGSAIAGFAGIESDTEGDDAQP